MFRIPLLLLLLLAGNAWSQSAMTFAGSVAGAMQPTGSDPKASHARSLAATCFTCHGTDGRSVNGVPPSLAGLNKDLLLKQLQDFRDGKRPATIMHQHAKGYTDEQLNLIAGYFAAVKPGPAVAAPAVK
jgi:sulfide dehydrogenase cytochrome subunit